MTDHVHELTCRGRRRHRSAVDKHMSLTRGRAGTSTWVLRYTVANIGRVYAPWSSHVCMKSREACCITFSRESVFAAAEPASMQIARPRSACKRPASANITFQASSCLFGRVSDSLFAVMNPGAGGLTKTLRAVRRGQSRGEIGGKYRFPIRIRYLYLFSPISAAGARIAPNENESVTRTRRKIV